MPTNHGPIWQHSSFSPTVTEKLLNPWPERGLHPTITSTMFNSGRYIQWPIVHQIFREIWNCAALDYYPVSSGNFLSTFQDNQSVPSSWLKNQRGLLDSWTLKMGLICCPKMSVRNYHYLLCNNPEECSFHLLHCGSLKSCMAFKLRLEHAVFTDFTSIYVNNYVLTLWSRKKSEDRSRSGPWNVVLF